MSSSLDLSLWGDKFVLLAYTVPEAEEDTDASHLLGYIPHWDRAFSALETYQECLVYINFLLHNISVLCCTESHIPFLSFSCLHLS